MMSGRTLRARAILDYNVDRALNKQAEDCKKGSVMQGNTVQQGARRSGRTAGKENGVSYREDSITDENTEGEDAGILMAPNGLQQEGKAPDQHRVQNGRNPKKQPAPLAESLSSGSIDKDEGSDLHPTSSSPGTLEDSESGPPPPRRGHTQGQRLFQPARKSSRASALEARGRIREQQMPLSSSMEEEEEEEEEQEQSGSEGSSAPSSDEDDEAGDIEGSSEDEASQNKEDGFGRPRRSAAKLAAERISVQACEDPFADFRRVGSGPTGNKSEPISRPGTRGSARVGSKSAAAKHAKHGDASSGDEGEEDVRGGSSDEISSQDGSASGSEGSLGASDDSKGGAARSGKASKPSPKRITRRAVMDSEDGTDGDDDSEDAPVQAKAPKASSKKAAAGPDNGHVSVSSNEEEEEEGLAEQDQDTSMDPGSADEERAPKQAAAVAASGRTRPVRECRQPKADTSTPAQGKLAGGSKSKKAQALEDLVEEEEESSDEEDGTHVFGPIKTVLSFDGKTNLYTIKYDGMSYRTLGRVNENTLMEHKPALLRAFLSRGEAADVDDAWLLVDRVITSRKSRKRAPKPRSQRTIPQRPHAPAATAPAAATDGKDARDADLADAELTDRIADDLEDDIEEVGEGMDAAGCAVQGVRAHKPKDDSRQASPETPADGASSLGDESFLNDGQPYAAPQPGCYEYLVKWKGLEYGEATWEHELDLTAWDDKVAVGKYWSRVEYQTQLGLRAVARKLGSTNIKAGTLLKRGQWSFPPFSNGRKLRGYQEDSVRWMVSNFVGERNCILGDEMGLGKTAQSISALECLRVLGDIPGPFLIVAPLTTLGHWRREVETWTDMNVVLYAGDQKDRQLIEQHELWATAASRRPKFTVLLVSYDMLLKEKGLFCSIPFAAGVFDEAHRLKSIKSSTRGVVASLQVGWKLLLTGTPIQNNMLELYAILNMLDPELYDSPDDFCRMYGGGPGTGYDAPKVEQIKALTAALGPVLLRRMKEDVETLPEKEEVVIWVELTSQQRAYYKALYSGQIAALLGGGSGKNLPNMRNLAMELRKLCNHPFLCDGLEDDWTHRRHGSDQAAGAQWRQQQQEALIRSSGKMVLLAKLLAKLRAENRKVLIFSQFKIMLDLIEDFCFAEGYPVERIDGSVGGRARQQAIDRFSEAEEKGNDAFVFLLSTRAGGQGITLTAADTAIIYDSDWNPQNDLQAMARCHRIGQTKEVTVYRLVTRSTYEEKLFKTASRKYGLDEAILGGAGLLGGDQNTDPEADSKRIAALLKDGAHCLAAMEGDEQIRKGDAFVAEDIEQILSGRTEKRSIGGRAGNTFSTATFAADDDGLGAAAPAHAPGRPKQGGDRDFWEAYLPDAVADHDKQLAASKEPVFLGPRQRKQVNYKIDGPGAAGGGGGTKRGRAAGSDDEDFNVDADLAKAEARAEHYRAQAAAAAAAATAAVPRAWSKAEVKALEEKLLAFAPGRWRPVRASLSSKMNKRGSKDIQHAGRGILLLIKLAAELGGISNKPAGPTRAMLEAEEKVKAKEETAAAAARAASKGSKKSASQSVVAAAPVAADAAAGGGGEEVDPEKALAAHAEHLEQLHARQAGEARTAVAMYADRVAKVLAEIKAGLKDLPEWLQPTLTGAETLQRLAKAAPAARDNWQALSRLGRLLKGQPMAGPDLLQRQVNKLQGKKEVTEDAEGDVNMGEQRAGAGTSGAASPAAVAQGKDGSSSGAGAEGGSGSASGTSSPGDNASQGSQGGEEGAVGSAAALEAILLPSIKRSEKLPAWWAESHDRDLLRAIHEHGYNAVTHSSARRTAAAALRDPALSFCKHVLPPEDSAGSDEEDGEGAEENSDKSDKAEQGDGKRGKAKKQKGELAAAEPQAGAEAGIAVGADGNGDVAMADAIKTSDAAGPERCDMAAWRQLINSVIKRLAKVLEHAVSEQPQQRSQLPRPSLNNLLIPTTAPAPGQAVAGSKRGSPEPDRLEPSAAAAQQPQAKRPATTIAGASAAGVVPGQKVSKKAKEGIKRTASVPQPEPKEEDVLAKFGQHRRVAVPAPAAVRPALGAGGAAASGAVGAQRSSGGVVPTSDAAAAAGAGGAAAAAAAGSKEAQAALRVKQLPPSSAAPAAGGGSNRSTPAPSANSAGKSLRQGTLTFLPLAAKKSTPVPNNSGLKNVVSPQLRVPAAAPAAVAGRPAHAVGATVAAAIVGGKAAVSASTAAADAAAPTAGTGAVAGASKGTSSGTKSKGDGKGKDSDGQTGAGLKGGGKKKALAPPVANEDEESDVIVVSSSDNE